MMLFQDGSKHAWLGQGPDLDLIVTMDDATSAITSIFLCEEEGTASSFRGLSETIRTHGLFSSFYTDRGSHDFITPKAGAKVDKTHLTQVGRALKQLHIEHIPSYSPQARRGAPLGHVAEAPASACALARRRRGGCLRPLSANEKVTAGA